MVSDARGPVCNCVEYGVHSPETTRTQRPKRKAMTAIHIADDFIRVGEETRPRRFADHHITGFTFRDDKPIGAGRWDVREWTETKIDRYHHQLAQYEKVRRFRFLRPILQRVTDRFESWQYDFREVWDEEGEMWVDDTVSATGLRSRIGRSRFATWAGEFVSAMARPTPYGPAMVVGCHFWNSRVKDGIVEHGGPLA